MHPRNPLLDNAFARMPASFYTRLAPRALAGRPSPWQASTEVARPIGPTRPSWLRPDPSPAPVRVTQPLPGSERPRRLFRPPVRRSGPAAMAMAGLISWAKRSARTAAGEIQLKGAGQTPYSASPIGPRCTAFPRHLA